MSRVLLLNPPGTQNYIRDYFCSKLSKAHYVSLPVTLLMLSGILSESHEVVVLDAPAEGLDAPETLKRLRKASPTHVLSLVGAASWDEDRHFLQSVKDTLAVPIAAIGDVMLDDTAARLAEAPAIDAALLNFATPDVLAFAEGRLDAAQPNWVIRRGAEILDGGRPPVRGEFRVPRPRHELFPLSRYRLPFMVTQPISSVLTDYGCPFGCTFCVIQGLGFGARPVADVIDELEALQRLGVRELFFLDQTFGVKRARTLELCAALAGPPRAFTWSCFSRADVMDEPILRAMARAGCHTVIFGVESGSDETLERYHKRLRVDQTRQALRASRRAGIRTAATFMLGLPGETEADLERTVRLALELPLDFVSFNVAIPRAGTPLRREAVSEGLVAPGLSSMDQSGLAGAMGTKQVSAECILAWRRRAIRRFYLRPAYLLRRLLTLRSWVDLKTQLLDGLGVIADGLTARPRRTNEGGCRRA